MTNGVGKLHIARKTVMYVTAMQITKNQLATERRSVQAPIIDNNAKMIICGKLLKLQTKTCSLTKTFSFPLIPVAIGLLHVSYIAVFRTIVYCS